MPISSAIRQQCRRFLGPDDEIQFVFPADIVGSAFPSVIFVVSRDAITILSTGNWHRDTPAKVLATNPRNVLLGPVDFQPVPSFALLGIRYEIDDEYVSVVNAADAELSMDLAPPDPLPDL